MYLCKKKITLGGKQYVPGEPIPDNAVLPDRVRTLVSLGCIAIMNVNIATEVQMPIGEEDETVDTMNTVDENAEADTVDTEASKSSNSDENDSGKQITTDEEKTEAEDGKQAKSNIKKGTSKAKKQEGDA